MPLFVLQVFFQAKRAERDALVDADIFSDDGSFTDYDSRSVVDKKLSPISAPG